MIKILNLYCGIGGNRKDWPKNINGQEVQITAVELNPKIAEIYQELYPDDEVIVEDAHEYLLNHYNEFDFIWASPPCQSHSRIRFCFGVKAKKRKKYAALYPDMKLWQEIVFLHYHAKGDWLVENVIPYYQPLIAPSFALQRHYFWSNKIIPKANFAPDKIRGGNVEFYQNRIGIDLSKYKGINKAQTLRNCVAPAVGEYIFNHIFNQESEICNEETKGRIIKQRTATL